MVIFRNISDSLSVNFFIVKAKYVENGSIPQFQQVTLSSHPYTHTMRSPQPLIPGQRYTATTELHWKP